MCDVQYMHLHLKLSKPTHIGLACNIQHTISYFNYFKIFTLHSHFELGQIGVDAICKWQTMRTTDSQKLDSLQTKTRKFSLLCGKYSESIIYYRKFFKYQIGNGFVSSNVRCGDIWILYRKFSIQIQKL